MAHKILIDTNVLLDYLLCRKPYEKYAREIIIACKDGRAEGYMAAHSVPNIFFILRKVFSTQERREILLNLCEIVAVSGIDKDQIENALKDETFADFEDCLQKECAMSFGAEYIVTRNCSDFSSSPIPCIEPGEFCKKI